MSAETHHGTDCAVTPVRGLLAWLLQAFIVLPEEWDELPESKRAELEQLESVETLLKKLVACHLLTSFQARAVREERGEDLILGSYRLLEIIGQGGMGTVFRAEHLQLRRQVAVKVLARAVEENPRLLHRFYAEARAVARLQHPNITACFDAGRSISNRPGAAPRDYFVMELIAGQDLHNIVEESGPLPPHRACHLFRQIADALAEAHRNDLIHRDIKPQNIIITPDWQAKVLDFGLARVPNRNMTEAGTLLGTVGYMAPEQARDPHGVDARADLWSLGATLYWALTGREAYPETGNPVRDLHLRFTTTPDPVRRVRPEVPAELSDLVSRLMETDPEKRLPSARTVATALSGFTLWLPSISSQTIADRDIKRNRVLVVDDDPSIRRWVTLLLKDDFDVAEAEDADSAMVEVEKQIPDLVIVDVNLPGITGVELVERMRSSVSSSKELKILLVSGAIPTDALGSLAASGADDFLCKPFKSTELLSRIRALIIRRNARTGMVSCSNLRRLHAEPSQPAGSAGDAEMISFIVSNLLVETNLVGEGHWQRVIRYVRAMAATAPDEGEYARLKNAEFVDLLAAVAPLYDVGILSVPRNVLLKPDKLDADERRMMESHTTMGADLFFTAAGKFAESPCLPIAAEISRSHHERWDGKGYPDQLSGKEIPLSARVLSIVAVYEALRSRRPYRPPMNHTRALKLIVSESDGQFDPILLQALAAAAPQFGIIHQGL